MFKKNKQVFPVDSLNRFISKGDNRSVKIKRNILISFLIRSLSIGISLSVVSLAIRYVNAAQYGVWLTMTSVLSWVTYFDFGLGNGLRNRLATAIAFKEYDKAKKYISTTYAISTVIAVSVFIIFCVINPYINWNRIFNVPSTVDENINLLLLGLSGILCIQFVLQLINIVLNSLQETAKAELISLLSQAGILVTLIVLKYTMSGSLAILVIVLNITPLAIILLSSIYTYKRKYKLIAPSFKSIDFSYVKSILNLEGAFFLIQIGSLVLFQSDNIILTQQLGPEAVTKFNVTYKVYSVILTGFAVITVPYWSAFTDAWAKKDYQWITGSVKRLREVWLFISLVIVPVFFVLAKFVFKSWFPGDLDIDWSLSLSMAVYVVFSTCLSFSCYFLYGIGKLRVLLALYTLVMLTNVPLGILMGKWWGIEGVILSNVIAFAFMSMVLWVQTNKILHQQAYGIWNL
jgi:O-antigen/teichoic acid export membrane protein